MYESDEMTAPRNDVKDNVIVQEEPMDFDIIDEPKPELPKKEQKVLSFDDL
jgi:hypothetical protein